MLYLIGIGLNRKGHSKEAYDAVMKSDKVYLESYTVDFPYKIESLEKEFKSKKIIIADRELVESPDLVEEAKNKEITLLVYGSPLTATTHISLIQEARKENVKIKLIYGPSVLDAVAETGLQLYKFGKIASMPNFDATSYVKIIEDNKKINAHTLILIDIGMEFDEALKKLVKDINKKLEVKNLIVCSGLGTEFQKIVYNKIVDLRKISEIKAPFCFIIPGKLHFIEEEFLNYFNGKGN